MKYSVWLCSVNKIRLVFWSYARVIYIISDVCMYSNCMVKRDSLCHGTASSILNQHSCKSYKHVWRGFYPNMISLQFSGALFLWGLYHSHLQISVRFQIRYGICCKMCCSYDVYSLLKVMVFNAYSVTQMALVKK